MGLSPGNDGPFDPKYFGFGLTVLVLVCLDLSGCVVFAHSGRLLLAPSETRI